MSWLRELKLQLPQLPSEEEWLEHINELEGLDKEAAVVRAKGYNLLADFQEQRATAERIGWLALWSKTITALESASLAFQSGSDWILQIISRSTFEWDIHVFALIEPILDLISLEKLSYKVTISERSREYAYRQAVDRLRAYTAWCIWSDKEYFTRIMDPKNLDKAWDANPAKQILEDPDSLQEYEALFGKLDIETDEKKLAQGRREMEIFYKNKIQQIDKLMADPQLKGWIDKIQKLQNEKKRPISFFNLFDEEATILKRLKKYGFQFLYPEYMGGSIALHGSTMEQFIHIDGSTVIPKLNATGQGNKSSFIQVFSDCNHIFVLLGALNHFVLKRSELRI